MRWKEFFEELEAEFQAASRYEAESQIADMVYAEAATIPFASRIRHSVGRQLSLRLRNGQTRHGAVREANHIWTLLHDGRRGSLIPHAAVSFAWPLGGAAPSQEGIANRITLGYVLRRLAGSGVDLLVASDGGDLRGRVALVGADYFDVRTHTGVVAMPWHAIVSIEG